MLAAGEKKWGGAAPPRYYQYLIPWGLVVLVGLPMKQAVGTSLMVIAVKSLVGVSGDLQAASTLNWTLIGMATALCFTGLLVGTGLSRVIPGAKLKPAFGWFILAMGSWIVVRQLV